MLAAREGHFEVTKLLLVAGALTEAKDNVSKTISIFTYIYICVCVCVDKFILPSYGMI